MSRLAFNFYPHYRVPGGDYVLLAKMLELVRQHPSEGIDRGGRHGTIKATHLIAANGRPLAQPQQLSFEFEEHNPTALWVTLPHAVAPGESVTVELDCCIRMPNKQGRWGHWEGVTFLTNSLPLLAFIDDRGWRPIPFVPWAQPWCNEAGVFRASVTLPQNELLACPAVVKSETQLDGGWKRIETEPFVGRDFSLLCSARYKEFRGEAKLPDGRCVALKVLAFAEHEHYATETLKIVGEAIPVFSRWFGHFPYPQFTIAESYFGWNGNECAGLVMIDERVFGMPHLARGYVEYLVSHETCHQWWYNLVGTNGYSEPFMDEGAATYFTHRLLDQKRGTNNPFLEWPVGLKWLPNMHRENYRYSSMFGSIRNGDMQPAAQDLPKFGHVVGLFTGAYDRGSKVYRLIEDQLGEAAFLDFTRMIVAKYSWRVLHAAEYRRELEEFTGRDWGQFFDRWVYGKGMTDWAVKNVDVSQAAPFLARNVPITGAIGEKQYVVTLTQSREYTEPTTLGVRLAGQEGFPVRIPVSPSQKPYSGSFPGLRGAPGRDFEYSVETLSDKSLRVTITSMADVEQLAVDPDGVLLDANPANNLWKCEPRFRLTPLFSSLDEADLTNDYHRWNFTAGPWVWGQSYQDPWYTRSSMVGLRAGAYRTNKFSGGLYAAYRTDFRDLIL
ncbi:MAG TPA: M1 family aminopeptidase, partial [Gemmataceae bacterium]|nr:M1 family aminopeptidase [Gemmataceae bacterium]